MKKLLNGLKHLNTALAVIATMLTVIGVSVFLLSPAFAAAEEAEKAQTVISMGKALYAGLGFLSAAISVAGACIGAGVAVSMVGSAAMGAVSERPELMGRSLLYVGLAEGIAIYGLVIAIMIIMKIPA